MLAEFGNPAAPDTVLPLVAASLRKNSTGNVAQKFGPYTDLGESAPVNAVHRIDVLGVLRSSKSDAVLLRLVNDGVRDDWQ